MKKVFALAVLTATTIIMNACSGEVSTSYLSENLKAEYEFYEDSIDNIKNTMGLSQEDADNVFTVLVTECGVDEKIQSVNKHGLNNEGVFDVWVGWQHLTITIKDNTVEKVIQGTEQLYPIADKSETEKVEQKTDETTHLTAYELVSMDGHPVLYDYLSTAHDFWDSYAEDRINFDDTYYSYKHETGECALSMETYEVLERNQKEHMIRSFEIYPNEKLSLDELLELAKTYLPMDVLRKWYALKWSDCYYHEKGNSYIYSVLYTPTDKGKEAIEKQNLDYNYAMVIIQMGDEFMPSILIQSTNSMPNTGNEYKRLDWEYDFLNP